MKRISILLTFLLLIIMFGISCVATTTVFVTVTPFTSITNSTTTLQGSTPKISLISYDLDIDGLIVWGSGNPFTILKNTGSIPVSIAGLKILSGEQVFVEHHLLVLDPGQDVRMMWGVSGDKLLIPEGNKEISVKMQFLGCPGKVIGLEEVKEESVILETNITVSVP